MYLNKFLLRSAVQYIFFCFSFLFFFFWSVVNIYVYAPRFNVLYKPDLWTEVCCAEDRLLKNLLNIKLALLQLVFFFFFLFFFSVSDKT